MDNNENDGGNVMTSTVQFYVTGFGKFGNITENPTTTIVNEILSQQTKEVPSRIHSSTPSSTAGNSDEKNNDDDGKNAQQSLSIPPTVSKCQVIKTAATNVTNDINELIDKIKEDRNENNAASSSTSTPHCHNVCLHLGVDYKGQTFKLESTAFNDASFRIPDEGGYQPKKKQIDESKPFGERLSTSLNVKKICTKMEEKGFDVKVSGDAGRFVCNYLYWTSLNRIKQEVESTVEEEGNSSSVENKDSTLSMNVHALFVHVPLFTVIDQQTQFDFINQLMDTISEVILTTKKKKKKKKANEY